MTRLRSAAIAALCCLVAAGIPASTSLASGTGAGADGGPQHEGTVGATPKAKRPRVGSDVNGALPPPEAWNCDQIAGEYRDWLDQGNKAGDWKYVGPVYVHVEDGGEYDWGDWIDWANGNGCAGGAFIRPEVLPGVVLAPGLVGGLITAAGAGGLIGAQAGSGPRSPG
ncbi:hypothetical protein [Erythrobacter mangrovi]|uniref:Uncharacterized protein n=1 Tax=Erythrobacter mangrovi TaxID=2739433 RepID=A0A7D4BX88_9SPHN|nr:hypothetical protein [Erythrobacter mangrovi]QKG72427.1 hypothetical protein HQR01_14210 [Erythrobacter mangrovi]